MALQSGPPRPWKAPAQPAQRVAVKVLFSHHDRYAIEPLAASPAPALTDATPVVIEGAERLFPMRPLNIVPPPPPRRW